MEINNLQFEGLVLKHANENFNDFLIWKDLFNF